MDQTIGCYLLQLNYWSITTTHLVWRSINILTTLKISVNSKYRNCIIKKQLNLWLKLATIVKHLASDTNVYFMTITKSQALMLQLNISISCSSKKQYQSKWRYQPTTCVCTCLVNVLSTCEDVKVLRASVASVLASSSLSLKLSN